MTISNSYKVVGILCFISLTTLLLRMTVSTDSYRIWKSQEEHHVLMETDAITSMVENVASYRENQQDASCSSKYGKPILGKDIVVVYNRVPKSGSRTMLSLVKILAQRNGYKRPKSVISSSDRNVYEKVKPEINSALSPAFLEGHIYFMDFANDSKYVFFNFVRDPLDRLVSQYYFARFGDDKFTDVKRLHRLTNPKFLNETFDECVLNERSSCVSGGLLSQQLHHFCGYHPKCRIPSRWAVEEAKRNIDKFLLVGVTEKYDDTLQLLEHLLPDFFKGLVAEYHKPATGNVTSLTKSKNKIAPSGMVTKIMKERLKYEYEVYNYAVNKFNRLKHFVFD